MEQSDLLWNLYLSEREFITHHENQRTSASNILGAIAAGLIVALGTDKLSPEVQVIAAVVLTVLGLFGYIFCAKLYALMKLHAERSYKYLAVLDETVASVDISSLKAEADRINKAKFKRFSTLPLNRIWAWFHLTICGLGIMFTVYGSAMLVS